MKRGVKASERWYPRQRLADRIQGRERLGLMQRRELAQLPQVPLDIAVDPYRLSVALAAMDYAVPNNVGLLETRAKCLAQLARIDLRSRCRQLARRERLVLAV